MCQQKKKELYRIVHGQISNLSLQQFTAIARKHTEYLYPVVHKTSLQSVQEKRTISNRRWLNFELKLTTIHCKCSQTHRVSLPSSSQNLAAKCARKKRTISNRQWLNFELKLTTIHCKCSQTHRVSLPSTSQNLAAKCASKKKELYRIVHGQFSNLSLQQFTASARKHTEYLYPRVHKTSPQFVQAKKKKELYQIVDRQISNLSLRQFTASARKHTKYLYPRVHKTSLKSMQAIKRTISNRPW